MHNNLLLTADYAKYHGCRMERTIHRSLRRAPTLLQVVNLDQSYPDPAIFPGQDRRERSGWQRREDA